MTLVVSNLNSPKVSKIYGMSMTAAERIHCIAVALILILYPIYTFSACMTDGDVSIQRRTFTDASAKFS